MFNPTACFIKHFRHETIFMVTCCHVNYSLSVSVRFSLQDDEFVVYNVNRQRIRYLIEFSMPRDSIKELESTIVQVPPEIDVFGSNLDSDAKSAEGR